MADEQRKVEIGFGIGQMLSVKMTDGELKDLRKAIEAGSGWYDVTTSDSSVALNLATIVFVRVNDAGHSIGFSS